nr:MAK10-like protein [Tanacetum cinerariifolium]
MGDTNPIRTLVDYFRPSHVGYRNTIELPEGNNVVPLFTDTIRLVQKESSFHRLRSEDPNQHLNGPHDTQYCMENPEQAFVNYASSRTDKARGKWYAFKPEQNNLGDTYNPSWKKNLDTRLSKFEADIKQQQSEMTNKIDTVLKATDQITRALPSDTVQRLYLIRRSLEVLRKFIIRFLEDDLTSYRMFLLHY